MKSSTILFFVFTAFIIGAVVFLHGFAQMMSTVGF